MIITKSIYKVTATEAATGGVCKKKGFVKNFAKSTGKHLFLSLFFNKVAGLRPEKHVNVLESFFTKVAVLKAYYFI